MDSIKEKFNIIIQIIQLFNIDTNIIYKSAYSNLEIAKYIAEINSTILKKIKTQNIKKLIDIII